MKILFIAPLPPPHTGNSLPILKLVNSINVDHNAYVIKTNKKKHKAGITSIGRIFKIISILYQVALRHKRFDKVYLSIAESGPGNVRDLFIYFILRKRLNSTYIHMFGGAAMQKILEPSNSLRFKLNKKYISKLAGVFVEGKAQKDTFSNVIKPDNIHIVPNFAENHLFTTLTNINSKFENFNQVRILFLSNMLTGKGHIELITSYNNLRPETRKNIRIDFAGKLVSDKELFLDSINGSPNVIYHGIVSGENKRKLFADAHIFCLPTYYPYEGQPFSIIEAYAAGCAVITTNHSGIGYIFANGINGIEVEKKSIESLCKTIENAVQNKDALCQYACKNFNTASLVYTEENFIKTVRKILLSE